MLECSLLDSVSWLSSVTGEIVLKAELKSTNRQRTKFLAFSLRGALTVSIRLATASSVARFGLYAYCVLSVRAGQTTGFTTRSNVFETTDVRATGLKSFGAVAPADFGIGQNSNCV